MLKGNFLSFFKKYIGVSNERSSNLKLQVVLSLSFKIISVLLTFLLVSALYSRFDLDRNGIWFTLISVLNIIILLDIGIGNGLRNRLAEAVARNEMDVARSLVSTAFCVILIICVIGIFSFVIINTFVRWQVVFNAGMIPEDELRNTMLFFALSISGTLFFGLGSSIFFALQKPAYANLLSIGCNLLFLGILSLTRREITDNLVPVARTYFYATVLSGLIFNCFLFKKYSFLRPSIFKFNKESVRELTSLGFSFFLLQLAPVVISLSDNIIISFFIGPSSVTNYSIAQRIFTSVYSVFFLFITPLWSSITEAHVKGDQAWIRKTIKNTLLLVLPLVSLVVLAVLLFFKKITLIWLHEEIVVAPGLLIQMSIFCLLAVWSNVFLMYLNGTSKLRQTMWAQGIGTIINIPIAIFCIKGLGWGVSGVMTATIISMLPLSIVGPYVTYKKLGKID